MLNTHQLGLRALAWRLGLLGAALGALTALGLWHGDASTAGDKGVEGDSVTVTGELAWVPPNAALFATVRPATLWHSAEGKILREQFPDLANDIERWLDRDVGMKPGELESVTFVFPDWSFLGGHSSAAAGKVGEAGPPKVELPPPVKDKEVPPAFKDQPVAGPPAIQPPPVPEYEPRELLIATAAEPAALARVLQEVKGNGAAKTHQGKTYYVVKKDRVNEAIAFYFVNERTLVRGSAKQIEKGLERTDMVTKGPLAPALRLAKEKHHLAIGLQLTQEEARDLLEELGRSFRGVKRTLKPLFQARAAAGFADIGKQTRAEVQVFFRDGSQAKAGLPAAADALTLLRVHGLNEALENLEEDLDSADDVRKEQEAMFGIQILEQVELGLRGFKAETNGGVLRVQAQAATDLAVMVGKTKELLKTRGADETVVAARNLRKSQNNLRQIGIALHNLNDTYKYLPPAALCDKQGKPCLSWRVAILPYLGHANLYNQFKLDEPWGSPHNIKLLAQMPKVYAAPGVTAKEPGLTYYQGFVADPKLGQEQATAWETTVAANSPFGAVGTRLPASFPDGTSNTIWVVEAGDAVPWTKPVDLPYDPKKPLPKLGGIFKEGFNALFVDASVGFVPRDFDVATLRLLITRADGQPLGPAMDRIRFAKNR
jgi:hypothetical protein